MASGDDALGEFLDPLVNLLGHKKRRQMCPLYVAGLIGPGERKSMQPMADLTAKPRVILIENFAELGPVGVLKPCCTIEPGPTRPSVAERRKRSTSPAPASTWRRNAHQNQA